jgi:hypothetical protein
MNMMRTALALACGLSLGVSALARPVIVEENATIANPLPTDYPVFAYEVATNGDYAVAIGYHDANGSDESLHYAALLFRRVNGAWAYDHVLDSFVKYYDSYSWPVTFAMKGNIAALATGRSMGLWQLTAAGWTAVPGGHYLVEDAEVSGQRVLTGTGGADSGGRWDGEVYERDAAGAWVSTMLTGQPRGNDDEFWGGPVDIDGDYAVLGTPYTFDTEPQEIPIYQRAGLQNWPLLGKLQVPVGAGGLGGEVAVRGNDAIVDASGGAYVWRLPDTSSPTDRLQAIDSTSLEPNYFTRTIEKSSDVVCVSAWSPDRAARVINVYKPDSSGKYQHVAVLVAKNGVSLRESFDIAGTTVIAGGADSQLHVFELPASFATPPALRHENFEAGAANWSPQAQAQWGLATSGTNHVYRQSSLAGDARAILGGASWRDQAIEADIRPTEFSGADRWVGLMTRYQDAANFTYVTLRSSGTARLRRVRGGNVTELASAPLAVSINRTYRVRLESIGSVDRVYVDGKLLLDVDDPVLAQTGSAGLATYKARADFDNVMVSPSPHTSIFTNDFAAHTGGWKLTGTGQWQLQSGAFGQNSIGGDARALIGTPTDDQIVQASVRPTAYAAASGTQERWAGLMARYTNDSNYYYLSMRSGNTLSLRKVYLGAITTLATVPLTVNLNAAHTLRLEAVGNQLRGYVDGAFALQASDSSMPSGQAGLVTYKAATNFDDFDAYQP